MSTSVRRAATAKGKTATGPQTVNRRYVDDWVMESNVTVRFADNFCIF